VTQLLTPGTRLLPKVLLPLQGGEDGVGGPGRRWTWWDRRSERTRRDQSVAVHLRYVAGVGLILV
jgi:hypothetical protein